MAVIIAGVFPSRDQAEAAVRELRDRGFDANDVGLVLRGGVVRAAAVGQTAGLDVFGWIPNHQTTSFDAIGNVLVAGQVADCLTRQGGAPSQRNLTDALTCMGIERHHAEWYDQQVKQGYSLVTVCTDNRGSEAQSIMRQFGSIEVPSRQRTPSKEPTMPASRSGTRLPVGSELLSVEPGWAVCGSDGKQIGKVGEVGPNYLLVKKGTIFTKDLYIPFDAVERVVPNQVTLNVSSAQVDQEHWERAPVSATAPSAPIGQTSDLSLVKQGYDVYTSDGQYVGTVQEASEQCVHVLCCSYMFVPPSRVERVTDDRIILNVPESDLDNYDWATCQPALQAEYAPGGPGYSGLPPQEHEPGVHIPIEGDNE